MSSKPNHLQNVGLSLAPPAAEGNHPSPTTSETSNESKDLAAHFPHSMKSLSKSFMNVDKVDKDWNELTKRSVPGTETKESVLQKNLRLSTTSPVTFAVKDASKALLKFETDDPIGRALAKGLITYDPKATPKEGLADEKPICYGLVYREVQQLQRKLTEKRDLELNRLYAQRLRCPADNLLDCYVPNSPQTPKPSHIKLELRRAVAEKTAVAIREARQEVFGKYLSHGELNDMMQRFNKIESDYSTQVEFVSKLLSETPESRVAADGARSNDDPHGGRLSNLGRIDSGPDAHAKIAKKINHAREAAVRVANDQKKSNKEQKMLERGEKATQARKELADAAEKAALDKKERDAAAAEHKKAVENLQRAQELDQKKNLEGTKSPTKPKHAKKGVNGTVNGIH